LTRRGRSLAVAAALTGAIATAGCGFGPGSTSAGTVTLTVTRDYGEQTLASASEDDPSESETVLRMLDRNTDITTRYGGGFVQSIDGLAGGTDGTRRLDWFFYVNGIESPVGSADVHLHGGDRIWWDYRDWTNSMSVPAVVGSFPQPFASAKGTVSINCVGPVAPCRIVANELHKSGVQGAVKTGLGHGGGEPRMLVGPWPKLKSDPTALLLSGAPAQGSGVFAAIGRRRLLELDVQARPVKTLRADAGLVAAVRIGTDAPTWVVTGTDAAGVVDAASQVNTDALRNRYAIAVSGHQATPLPVPGPEATG
jgi:Domain of unknown function (DUF4430)